MWRYALVMLSSLREWDLTTIQVHRLLVLRNSKYITLSSSMDLSLSIDGLFVLRFLRTKVVAFIFLIGILFLWRIRYGYQMSQGEELKCGGADKWADVQSSEKIFCPAGKYCPSTVIAYNCTKGWAKCKCFAFTWNWFWKGTVSHSNNYIGSALIEESRLYGVDSSSSDVYTLSLVKRLKCMKSPVVTFLKTLTVFLVLFMKRQILLSAWVNKARA